MCANRIPKRYPREQSPIYKLRNRRKLASLFGLTLKEQDSDSGPSDASFALQAVDFMRLRRQVGSGIRIASLDASVV